MIDPNQQRLATSSGTAADSANHGEGTARRPRDEQLVLNVPEFPKVAPDSPLGREIIEILADALVEDLRARMKGGS